jgi:group I intron endonuclease
MFTLYLITNTVNNKVYIGQTTKTAEERLQYHLWSANKRDYCHYAVRKYGKKAFVTQTLAEFETQEEVNEAEKAWIVRLGSHKREVGYNSTLGGDYGQVPNDDTRKKIGNASRGRTHSPETRTKMSEAHSGQKNHFYGKKHEPEAIEAMRQKLRESLGGENNPWFGKTLSPEHRAKISQSKTGKKLPPRSKEACKKLSEAAKARWARSREVAA